MVGACIFYLSRQFGYSHFTPQVLYLRKSDRALAFEACDLVVASEAAAIARGDSILLDRYVVSGGAEKRKGGKASAEYEEVSEALSQRRKEDEVGMPRGGARPAKKGRGAASGGANRKRSGKATAGEKGKQQLRKRSAGKHKPKP